MRRILGLRNLRGACALGALLSLAGAGAASPGLAASPSQGEKDGFRYGHVHALVTDAGGKTLWMGTHHALLRSEDGGKTWKEAKVSPRHPQLEVMSIAPDMRNPKVIYLGTHEAGVFKTVDGGATWARMSEGLGGQDIHGLAFDPNSTEKLHAAVRDGAEGIYRTRDGGKSWERVADGPKGEVKSLASVNLSTGMGGIYLYAGTTEGLFKSPD
ncbi:MAG: hypothetical protein HYZ11_17425 [Candidatus Tectomicrobia bacterium]|uniref:Sortilin N-terminal domain-containing protein n=1 Tax=Tectimicrobiota bacterium TaxID=2528274 RepID=A0A932I596_UNCTE|nr:hypothetical protein [Candidatus Tectomicrobia bacterium]